MAEVRAAGQLLARCAVCRGDIREDEPHEVWEGGYYCERHSLPHLRDRARQFAALLKAEDAPRRKTG